MARPRHIAVIGAGDAPAAVCELARAVGLEIAAHKAVLVCGGLGGVMAAAAEGARNAGGHTVGILPGGDPDSANRFIEFPVATAMGQARNAVVVASSDAVIALGGEWGTLSEIGLAMKLGRPVVALGSWHEIRGLERAETPAEAVALALRLARKGAA